MTKPRTLLRFIAPFNATIRGPAFLLLFVFTASALAREKLSLQAPDSLAGQWEAPDGHGGAIGMNIAITTHINGTPAILTGQLQYEDEFIVAIYQRAGRETAPSSFRFFSAAEGGAMAWDGHHLTVHSPGGLGLPVVDIDLTWSEDSRSWSGLFERDSFRRHVLLKRPGSLKPATPFVGTWLDRGGMANNCIHIHQGEGGTLAVWSDDIQTLSGMRYANGIEPLKTTREHYGEMGKGSLEAPDRIAIELRAFTAGCCSYAFTMKLSADQQSLVVPIGAPRRVVWTRMSRDSCLSKRPFPPR